MSGIVVADTGPLIALGRVGYLQLLQALYREIFIPPAVHTELRLGSERPGAEQLVSAMAQGWLQVRKPSAVTAQSLSGLALLLDPGEAEAIVLAEEMACRFLLIDERKGRAVARRRGVQVVGTAGLLLAAKRRGFVDEVLPIVRQLEKAGYRLSKALIKEIAGLAGEHA